MFCTFLAAAAVGATASGAERDICEDLKGPDLIRCIEAAARTGTPAPGAQPGKERAPAPGAPASPPTAAPSASVSPAPPAGDAYAVPRRTPTDCTGQSGEDLRRCLAAGGILAPEAATVSRPAAPTPAAAGACDGKTGDALRMCVEAQAKSADARKPAQPQPIRCTGYAAADQPLCVHRNAAIVECRNRSLYPDFDICMRSQMAQAPEPQRADCGQLPARQRDRCEARNRVFASCRGDKVGYFACLERHLGEDAVLTRR